MPVISADIQDTVVTIDKRSGKADIASLLRQKRIKIDPETGEVVGPRPNIIRYEEQPIVVETKEGHKIKVGTKKFPINGGHCLSYHPITGKQDCCWRMGLADTTKKSDFLPFGAGGPKRYHLKKMKDDNRYAMNPHLSRDTFVGATQAPTLEDEPPFTPTGEKLQFSETQEYHLYLQCMKEKGEDLVENEDFYKWMEDEGITDVVVKGKDVKIVREDEKPSSEELKEVTTAEKPKRKGGRPKGSKNKVTPVS